MEDVLIKAENVSKKFSKDLKRSLYYGVLDVFGGLRGSIRKRELRKDEFWAVKGVSFDVKRGECLGLIGHNGAGKSTLLKMLNGLISPDEGTIIMNGKIGALIELGAGFNPILTGRENIYNNAAVIGFTKKEIDAKFDSIVAFSEISEFLDMPVQNYSSGMKVRLGFAIAAQMEPDVLIIDEVLAVGDVGFRVKCLNRISELLNKCAVIFVSHSMPQIGKICSNAILLKGSRIENQSKNISEVIESYYSCFENESNQVYGNGLANINSVVFCDVEFNEMKSHNFNLFDKINIKFKLDIDKSIKSVVSTIVIFNMEQRSVALISSFNQNIIFENSKEDIYIVAEFVNYFSAGKYSISIDINEYNSKLSKPEANILISSRGVLNFISSGSNLSTYCPVHLSSKWSSS